jgi:hypothetical protein
MDIGVFFGENSHYQSLGNGVEACANPVTYFEEKTTEAAE